MRKYLVLMFVLCVFISGCSQEQLTVDAYYTNEIITDSLSIKNIETGSYAVLDDGDRLYIQSIWDGSNWRNDITKTLSPYSFTLDSDLDIFYSAEAGVFNDRNRGMSLFVSEEQRIAINSIIEKNLVQ